MPAAISHWLSLVWQPFLIILNLPFLTPRLADRRHTLDRRDAVTVEDIVLRMRAVRTAVHPQRIVDRIRPKLAALYAGLWIDSGFSDEARVPGGGSCHRRHRYWAVRRAGAVLRIRNSDLRELPYSWSDPRKIVVYATFRHPRDPRVPILRETSAGDTID